MVVRQLKEASYLVVVVEVVETLLLTQVQHFHPLIEKAEEVVLPQEYLEGVGVAQLLGAQSQMHLIHVLSSGSVEKLQN